MILYILRRKKPGGIVAIFTKEVDAKRLLIQLGIDLPEREYDIQEYFAL